MCTVYAYVAKNVDWSISFRCFPLFQWFPLLCTNCCKGLERIKKEKETIALLQIGKAKTRGVLRTLSKIEDGAFCKKSKLSR